jgi:hypothetical protein
MVIFNNKFFTVFLLLSVNTVFSASNGVVSIPKSEKSKNEVVDFLFESGFVQEINGQLTNSAQKEILSILKGYLKNDLIISEKDPTHSNTTGTILFKCCEWETIINNQPNDIREVLSVTQAIFEKKCWTTFEFFKSIANENEKAAAIAIQTEEDKSWQWRY